MQILISHSEIIYQLIACAPNAKDTVRTEINGLLRKHTVLKTKQFASITSLLRYTANKNWKYTAFLRKCTVIWLKLNGLQIEKYVIFELLKCNYYSKLSLFRVLSRVILKDLSFYAFFSRPIT